MYVTIVDENDNAPVFQQPHYEILLDEGPDTINTSLLTIQALDLDEGPNGTVIYTLVAGNIINTFHINGHTVAAGGVQEKGQLAKGIRGELSGMEGMEAEPSWGGQPVWEFGKLRWGDNNSDRGSPSWPGRQAYLLRRSEVLVPRVPQTHCLSIHPCPSMPQGVISAVKELDYEISNGRYTLLVTATDQCPILSHRLTSTTTVGGGTQPQLGSGGRTWPRKLQWGRETRKDCPEEMPKSKSLAPVLATHPNLLCDFEEVTVSVLFP